MSRANYTKRIFRALDRAARSVDGDATRITACTILTLRHTCEWFDIYGEWTTEAVRAVVKAYAQNAPLSHLAQMAAIADEEVQWCEWYDAEGYIEGNNGTPLFPSEAEARRWS